MGWVGRVFKLALVACVFAGPSAHAKLNCAILGELIEAADEAHHVASRTGLVPERLAAVVPNIGVVYDALNDVLNRFARGLDLQTTFETTLKAYQTGSELPGGGHVSDTTMVALYRTLKNFIPPDLAVEAAGTLYAKTGIRVDGERDTIPLPKQLSATDPGVSFLRSHGYAFSHNNRLFDARSTLSSVKKYILDREAALVREFGPVEGRKKLLLEIQGDPKAVDEAKRMGFFQGFEGFWANHGDGHTVEISYIGLRQIKDLRTLEVPDPSAKGKKKKALTDGEADILEVGHVLLAKTHDQGMADPFNEGNRVHHWKINGKLAFGAQIPGMGTQAKLVDLELRKIAAEKPANPLVALLRKAAETPTIAEKYKGTVEQRVETLLREYMLGSYSHGYEAGVFEVPLGLEHLGTRRDAYLKALRRTLDGKDGAEKLDLADRYKNPDEGFMAWAKVDAANLKGAEGETLRELRKLFSLNEALLNSADADRSKGKSGGVTGAGNAQPFLVNGPNGPEGRVVVTDARDGLGHKIVLPTGPRQARSLQVGPVNDRGFTSGKPADFTVDVLPTVANDEKFGVGVGGAAGSVAANKTRSNRSLLGDLGVVELDTVPKIHVRVPFAEKGSDKFRDGVKKGVNAELARSFVRNNRYPEKIDPKVRAEADRLVKEAKTKPRDEAKTLKDQARKLLEDSMAQALAKEDIVSFEYAAAATEVPEAKNLPELKKKFEEAKDLSDHLRSVYAERIVAGGAPSRSGTKFTNRFGKELTYTPDNLLKGARKVKFAKGETIIMGGSRPDFGYVLLEGKVSGRQKASTGNADFAQTVDPTSGRVAALGITAFLGAEVRSNGSGGFEPVYTTGRNSTVVAETDVEVLMIPKETVLDYWDPAALTLTAEELPDKLRSMKLDPNQRNPQVSTRE